MADSFPLASGCEEFRNSSRLFFFFCMPTRFILSAGAESLRTATATASVFAELEQSPSLYIYAHKMKLQLFIFFKKKKFKTSGSFFYLKCCWLELQTELLSEQLPAGEIRRLSILHARRQFSLTD